MFHYFSLLVVGFYLLASVEVEAFVPPTAPSSVSRVTAGVSRKIRLFSAVSVGEEEASSKKIREPIAKKTQTSDDADKTTVLDSHSTENRASSTKQAEQSKEEVTGEASKYDFPWTDAQQFALMDQLSKYTIQIPQEGKKEMQIVTLWRTLSNEVIELSGYPVSFLVDRQMELQQQPDCRTKTSPNILPYLDDYEFTTAGGISGAVYGVQGVADGTRIETSAVENVQVTLPKGFVQTNCKVLYELGRPLQLSDTVGGASTATAASATAAAGSIARSVAVEGGQQLGKVANDLVENPPAVDPELVQLGVLTGLVVAGAAAVGTLSHHLTVNVFWV